MGLGDESLRLVLVHPLDMGHNLHAARVGIDFCDLPGAGFAGWGAPPRLAPMDALRRAVGCRSIGQSHHARVPAILRAVDLVAEIPSLSAVVFGRRTVVISIFSGAFTVAGAEL